MSKKYEFTDETTEVDGHTLHRIRAVRCFLDVKAGDFGGWQGGNKNELVVCIGLDNRNRVMWSDAFSWCDSPVLAVKSRDWFMSHRLDLCAFASYIEPIIQKEWKRKNFSDFKYVSVELSNNEYWAIIIIMLLLNIGLSVWVVTNDYNNKYK